MKNALLISLVILQLSCKKEHDVYVCKSDALDVIDTACLDLKSLVTRKDTSSWYGYATATKSVPQKGAIEWTANNIVDHFSTGDSYLLLNTFADTAWVGLEYWSSWRENVRVKFDPFKVGKQSISNKAAYDKDKTLNTAQYQRIIEDAPPFAVGDIDMGENNYIEVTKVDHEQKIVEGTFNLNFILQNKTTLPYAQYSKNVNFQCGNYRAKINEY
jgi:hypothetical protein